MKKLFIQIPCLNESESLPIALADLPRNIEGIDEVLWLVIDDGSTDGTSEVALSLGVDYVVRFSQNKGLASAFSAGIDACLKLGADIIVNTDADNQYDASAIPELVKPILDGTADVVVGDRNVSNVDEFSVLKKLLQKFGTRVVSSMSGVPIADATSGFRAYSRDAALQINLVSNYTYTLESLIQAGHAGLSLANIPVKRNDSLRPSRLFKSTGAYIRRNAWSLFRLNTQYKPLQLFMPTAFVLSLLGFLCFLPWAIDVASTPSTPHIQSTILGAILIISSVQVALFGLLADAISSVRHLSVNSLERLRVIELQLHVAPRLHPGVRGDS